MNSLAECFIDMYDGDLDKMKPALESSTIPKEEYIKGNPVYTFSDKSYIMLHSSDKNMYTVANVKGNFQGDWEIEGYEVNNEQ